MAGDWLKVEKDTPTKPEILAMAAMLNLDPDIVFARCLKVWMWADSHTVDGNAPSVTPALLDSLIHTLGFADALLSVGWLVARNGSLQFPNFDRHMGQSAKKRALTSKRVQESRSKVKRSCNAPSVTEALPEKRREEKSIEDKERERPANQPARFTPPTVEEVSEYCRSRNNAVDADTFVAFYASKGWKVGNSPMKDWRAAVRTWEKRAAEERAGSSRGAFGGSTKGEQQAEYMARVLRNAGGLNGDAASF